MSVVVLSKIIGCVCGWFAAVFGWREGAHGIAPSQVRVDGGLLFFKGV